MAAISVTTSATLVATGGGSASYPSEVIITNNSGNSVYLGADATVTTANGILLADGATIGLQLVGGRTVYGIAGSTSEVRAEVWD